ncbi:hypothetical protein DENSPDRAFT_879920 [Dentipellis sp. KUC8613]|nr:hypothetical protein DENSPDRAFT_879920 [Dentipellis sp. KUC8613]
MSRASFHTLTGPENGSSVPTLPILVPLADVSLIFNPNYDAHHVVYAPNESLSSSFVNLRRNVSDVYELYVRWFTMPSTASSRGNTTTPVELTRNYVAYFGAKFPIGSTHMRNFVSSSSQHVFVFVGGLPFSRLLSAHPQIAQTSSS